jgi:hypothetical protein
MELLVADSADEEAPFGIAAKRIFLHCFAFAVFATLP